MARIVVRGGNPLSGSVAISGAKNSALKIMAAALLTDQRVLLRNVPNISDVAVMSEVLQELGVEAILTPNGVMQIWAGNSLKEKAPYHLVNQMRASVIVLGPLLARLGEAQVAMPGGCNIGSRKIDLHIRGLELMEAEIEARHGYIEAKAGRLRGAVIPLDFPSVGATENLMMAATLAKGTTIIENAAREPEIVDLADCLNAMGARISGAGTCTIIIKGVSRLNGADFQVMPDRIEAGTYMAAGAITGGEIFLAGAREEHLALVIGKLRQIGVEVITHPDGIQVKSGGRLRATNIATLPYPGFPTDLQAQFMALLSIAEGASVITENVFDSRFVYVDELRRLGSKIVIEGHHAVVQGGQRLAGSRVKAPDLRGGAALVIAGLAASGTTEVSNIFHIERGYENFETKLRALGADVTRETTEPNVYILKPDKNPASKNLYPAQEM